VRRNGGTEKQILSAAHCGLDGEADIGNERKHSGEKYGHVTETAIAGRVDAERHSINSSFNGKRWIYLDNDHKGWTVNGVSTWAAVNPLSDQVCQAGFQHANAQCGEVTDKDVSWVDSDGRQWDHMIRASACAIGGDSGAGVFGEPGTGIEHIAFGILHSVEDASACDGSPWMIFSHIEYVQNRLDVSVLTTD
jgi:hypothetical protein